MSLDDHIKRKLIKGCIRNERAAQKQLYQTYYAYAMSICLRYSNSKDDAVEILNDGFMKVFKYLKGFDAKKPFRPWFGRIMVNAAIDHFNKNKSKIETSQLEKALNLSDKSDIIQGISYDEIIDMMQQLPPSYRTVFNLYVVEGYSHEEIATQLGVTVGTTKSNLFKAGKHMREILEKVLEKPYVE
ncbi:MAG: RNA polymerase sigma factor [Cyclobacteriaceae bacterium]